jgi:hypothetical protein
MNETNKQHQPYKKKSDYEWKAIVYGAIFYMISFFRLLCTLQSSSARDKQKVNKLYFNEKKKLDFRKTDEEKNTRLIATKHEWERLIFIYFKFDYDMPTNMKRKLR